MRFLLDFFANWTFDKVMDYTLAAVIWFVFNKSKQTEYPDHFEERRRHRN
ncbi:hypothetical protein ACMX8W_11110 [Bacillus subtilis]|nr:MULTISPECIES: hypothetical protein [Bacillus]UOX38197.1 hypothetical protein [Bacillus phage BUCT083]MBE1868627.1 hypothetical protein [Bacillus subtilis]MDQ4711980.1 hypothetical protein [Bacillus subtilis]NMJ92982.1 hypothetical protein [Bacillus sp. WR12]NUC10238.1 hypothetical protein [Bacillus subtilis]